MARTVRDGRAAGGLERHGGADDHGAAGLVAICPTREGRGTDLARQQYARAIGLFQRKYANTFPPTVDMLVEQKFLRKKYKDPITSEDFQLIPAGGAWSNSGATPHGPRSTAGAPGGRRVRNRPFGAPAGQRKTRQRAARARRHGLPAGQQPSIGIQGVVSKSRDSSIKIYNGRTKYNEWAFVYLASAQRIQPGCTAPAIPGAAAPAAESVRRAARTSGHRRGDRRPGVGNPNSAGAAAEPFGQPSPFGQPQPSGQPRRSATVAVWPGLRAAPSPFAQAGRCRRHSRLQGVRRRVCGHGR